MLYYIILYYIILYYIILHYVILHYIILYYIILYYVILHYVILHYIILYYIILYYIIFYFYESQLAGSLLIANEVSRRGSGGQAVARSPQITELGAVDGWQMDIFLLPVMYQVPIL